MGAIAYPKKLFIFGFIAGAAIVLLAFSPTIYAIVEPHIIINMDANQTTSPLQIKDTVGNDVFEVESDGQLKGHYFLNFEIGPETTQTITLQGIDNYQELAKWRFDFTTDDNEFGSSNIGVQMWHGYMTGLMRSSENSFGAGIETRGEVVFAESDNGSTGWNDFMRILHSDQLYSHVERFNFGNTLCDDRPNVSDPCFVGVLWGGDNNNNGTLFLKNFELTVEMDLPQGATITRVS